MSDDMLHDDGSTTPLCRAGILTGVLGIVASSDAPVTFSDILYSVMNNMVLPEEAVSGEVGEALLWLVSSGVVLSTTYDEEKKVLHTDRGVFCLSKNLHGFVWRDLPEATVTHDGGDTVQ